MNNVNTTMMQFSFSIHPGHYVWIRAWKYSGQTPQTNNSVFQFFITILCTSRIYFSSFTARPVKTKKRLENLHCHENITPEKTGALFLHPTLVFFANEHLQIYSLNIQRDSLASVMPLLRMAATRFIVKWLLNYKLVLQKQFHLLFNFMNAVKVH